MSEPARLSVVIDAAPYASIPECFGQAWFKVLLHLDVPVDVAAETTRAIELATRSSRSVLGTLSQFVFRIESDLRYGNAHSAQQLTWRLAETVVVKVKEVGFPADRVREALGLAPLDCRHPVKGYPPCGVTFH